MNLNTTLCVSHSPWVRERSYSLKRLSDALGIDAWGGGNHLFMDRAPNWVWSEEMWRWPLEVKCTDPTHCLFLQDDVIVAPNFWRALHAMLEAVPDQIIGLEAAHPAGMTIAREGGRWYTTSDGLIGPGYVFPRKTLQEFLEWRKHTLSMGAVEAITEDTLISLFALVTGRHIWHPVPTIIDHDTSVESTYGNDHHRYRRPSVTWRDGDVCGWDLPYLEHAPGWAPKNVPHLGRFYNSTYWLAKRWVKGWDDVKHKKAEADRCPERYARWF